MSRAQESAQAPQLATDAELMAAMMVSLCPQIVGSH